MKRLLLMSFLLMITLLQQVSAQNRTISGRVTDRQTGEGLPGVTVLVKGTTIGISTNSDGTYTLSIPNSTATLTFTSVGYITQERAISTDNQINVVLAADTKQLSEVVVTGYGGSQDVKDITGSVAQVKSDKLTNQPVQSVDQALAGRMAGVQVTNPGGTLADGVSVRIRGTNSISGSSQPLYVVDGVPLNTRENANTFNGGNGTRYNPLADINPNDIASVEVLKDASASAIYGSRASNGVIIITTKRGKAGQTHVSINSWAGLNEPTRKLSLLNGDDFIAIQNEKAANKSIAPIAADVDLDGDGQVDKVRTDWQKEIYKRQFSQSHQAAVSGGTDKASFYGSGTYTDQRGIILTNRLRQGAVRLNVDVTPKKWLKAGVSSGYTQTLNHGVLTDGYLAGATVAGYNAPPNVPVYAPTASTSPYYMTGTGLLGVGGNNTAYVLNNFYNPVAVVKLQRNDNTSRRLLANTYLEIQPITGLRLTTRYGVDYLDNFEDQYSDPRIGGLGTAYGGLIQDNRLDRTQWNWQNYINYDKTIGEQHNFGATVGLEYQQTTEQQVYTGAAGIVDPKFNSILDGLYSGTQFSGGTKNANAFRSYFGRVNYSFGTRYYAQFALRADADSRFGKANQTGFFPGGSVGWRISEENFMKGISAISDMKLRASYGLVGNSNGLGSYASRDILIGGGQYADLNGLSVTQIGNSKLKWETSKKLDIGMDLSLLKNRIGLTFDYFNTNISGLVLYAPTANTLGIPSSTTALNGSIARNVGSMYNRGIEAALNTTNVETANGFRWTSSLNLSIIKNRITALNDQADLPSGNQRASIGRSLGVYQLIRWAGVNPDNGNAQFLDKDGNVKQYDAVQAKWFTASGDATTAITQSDAKYTTKTGYPTWYGGFDNTFTYKGFDLTVFLQYSGGNMVYNTTRSGLLTTYLNNNLEEIKDRWQKPGDQTDIQKLVLRDNVSTQASTRWLEKGDFLRMRQIGLGYNLPATVTGRIGISNLRVYTLVQNAFIFTNYKGADPEVNSNRNNSNIAYGVDNRSVPQTRSYTVGLNFTL
ncbi:TonB-dependent receptor [Hymenobacter sp. GOD-10R]|uniref:SusC/RagA family TonB-linked outer membrane protein n=1 Tax=Hymenobacter sp. GOD-10R TaxID=3093922 RepID=UPI002D791D9D|nr:TonB-dependent receptor [Hymenobacter sp. GOD-10R]WRQ29778.1 TonB-dependent receptor [Hymenobacter sp. GOD-10R]